jgi:hypothetical protein
MTLPTQPLGNSGLHITRVGLGSWAVGGWLFGSGRATSRTIVQPTMRRDVALQSVPRAARRGGRRSGMALEAIDYRAAPVRPTACRDPVVEIDTFIADGLYGGGHESL